MDEYGLGVGLENILIGLIAVLLARRLYARAVLTSDRHEDKGKKASATGEKQAEADVFRGRQLRAWGSLVLAAGIVALLIDLGGHPSLFLGFLIFPIVLVIPVWRGMAYARKR
jgi:hypothetical protein